MRLHDFVPPVASRVRARLRPAVPTPTFDSYEAARRACANGAGYEDDHIAQVVLAKTRAAQHDVAALVGGFQTAVTLLAVRSVGPLPGPIRVLDFGGAFGTAYHLARALRLPLRWAVVESATFARHGAAITTDELRVVGSIEEATDWLGGVDLVYSSGTLQSTPDPEGFLSALVALDAPVLALLRGAFSLGTRVIEVQSSFLRENGPGPMPQGLHGIDGDQVVQYPRTFMREADMRATCGQRYRLVAHLSDTPERRVLGGHGVVSGDAYLWAH